MNVVTAKRPQTTLWLLLALLILPFATAAALYVFGWRPAHPANHGELLQPPRDLPPLAGADGKAVSLHQFDGQWTLIVAGAGPCIDTCRHSLAQLRQVHVALYKQMSRVRRVWLSDQPKPDAAPLLAQQPDLLPLVAADPAARAAFDLDQPGHRVFVVDPLGHIILRYAPDADPRGLLKDMERLLRYAWAG
jgi:cytochrome oxidase Cu insertion factor (SCO1/SenC/PrrC family)